MVRVRVVTPVPLHSSHGCSMIEPLPRHSVHGSEKPNAPWLRLIDTRAVAVRAHLRAGARTCPAAVAIRARRRAGQPQRHRHTLGGLQEGQLGLGLQVVAAARPAGSRLLRAAAEQPAEQVADVRAAGLAGRVEQVVEVELGAVAAESAEVAAAAAEPAAAEAAAGEQPSGFVVLLALGRIATARCGLGHGLEPSRRPDRSSVGMELGEQLAVGPLDLFGAGVRGDAELLVEVLLDPFSLGHAASPPYLCRTCRIVV